MKSQYFSAWFGEVGLHFSFPVVTAENGEVDLNYYSRSFELKSCPASIQVFMLLALPLRGN